MGRGGKRQGSGAKLKYGEKTITSSFSIPKSKEEEVIKIVKSKLSEYLVKKNRNEDL